MEHFDSRTPRVVWPCPSCGSPTLPILYGFPGHDMLERAERGEFVLGGCAVGPEMPTRRCTNCDRDLLAEQTAPDLDSPLEVLVEPLTQAGCQLDTTRLQTNANGGFHRIRP